MKLNKIWPLFCVCTLAGIIFRFYQLFHLIEAENGFFVNGMEGKANLLLILILLCTLFVGFFAYLCFKRPKNIPQKSIFVSVAALALAGAVFTESCIIKPEFSVLSWQLVAFNIASILLIGYLVALAIRPYYAFPFPEALSAIPLFYLIIRTICDFTTISKLALISDNVLLIAIYCVGMLFFVNFAKLYIKIDLDKNFKKLISFGLSTCTLCFAFTVPNFLIICLRGNTYPHISLMNNVFILLLGIFILAFISAYFSKKNI